MTTMWYSKEYYVHIDVLRRYLLIEFDNLLLRLFILLVANKQYPRCLQIPLLLPP